MYLRKLSAAAAAAVICLPPAYAAGAQSADPQLVLALRQAVRDTPDIANRMYQASWLAAMFGPLETRVPDPFFRI